MLEWVFFPILGLILGSFANVLILREERGESIGGRSHCVSCARTLTPYELVPVLSYLFLRGKCRTCHAPISVQYPLVELLMAIAVTGVGLAPLSPAATALGILIVFFLICIAMYDLRTMYIPNRWVYVVASLAFLYGMVEMPSIDTGSVLMHLSAGPLTALPLVFLWGVSRGTWMGFGDVQLAVAFGWLLGIFLGFVALGLSFVLGAILGLLLIGITRFGARGYGFTMRSEVSFGPFLIFSLCVVWIAHAHGLDIGSLITEILVVG